MKFGTVIRPSILALFLIGAAAFPEVILSTADGNGADTFVGNDSNKGPNSNYGSSSTMDIRNYTGVRAHIGYVRFDLNPIRSRNLSGAQLRLFITSAQNSKTWNIYGVNDGSDDFWNEMTITYNNSPWMLPAALGNFALNEAKVTFLGTLYVPAGSNYTLTSSPSSLNLDSFLAGDTNGLVTFVLIGPADGSGSQYYAATKEGISAPAIILPNAYWIEPANQPQPDGTQPVSGDNVVFSWRPGQIPHPTEPGQTIADPKITGFYLYWIQYPRNSEPQTPDFSGVTPVYVPRGTQEREQYPISSPGLAFSKNQVVYWRVDESVYGSQAAAPETILGPVWRFETEQSAPPRRYMENLGRGVAAVRNSSGVFVSWRLLGTDPEDIGFNLYRSAAGGSPVRLNNSVLTGGTNFTDTTANLSVNNTYFIRPVLNGAEQAASGSYTLPANSPVQPLIVIPLQTTNTDEIHFVWVGDLDGDGEYDFVLDRLNWEGRPQSIEAYRRDGSFLWSVNLGPNSTNTYTIEPGSATIDVGHWDGVTVYDLDCDRKAEVVLRTARGVVFGDGTVLTAPDDLVQFISVLNGMTGTERARIQIPTDYIADGPMGAHMGIGYLNGKTPSIIATMKNRIGDGDFNMMICAWDFDGTALTQRWKWLRGSQNCPDGHQIRIIDVDGDGMDEVCNLGFVLRNNGTLLYNLGEQGIVHGDRWHIGKFDPSRPGLQGYGIQQSNPSGLRFYYYDAGTGQILWSYSASVVDVGRGDVGDTDPQYPGFECWAFDGMWNGPAGIQIAPSAPWPCLRLWWDGDELSESYNDGKIEKWIYSTSSVSRLVTTWNYETYTRSDRGCPMFYGDILGDWREEVIVTNSNYTKLGIFTTNVPTSRRIYALPHNPAYRNGMTVKGYMQSHHVDFYLGHGMSTPPKPPIRLAGVPFHPTDLVRDGKIDLNDFAVMSSQWRNSPAAPSADLAPVGGDGQVNLADLASFCENWLTEDSD
ncbi:MAG TPA: DNRLRE domain-containing protein [Anaerohalosphaeraceae bacterium]|nr:DNRLRE domain-containing protein [Anaerohalosphaeraceae bacterium]